MTNLENMTKVGTKFDEEGIDPAEYARLLELYNSSFRNISDGEVIKGTVLRFPLQK